MNTIAAVRVRSHGVAVLGVFITLASVAASACGSSSSSSTPPPLMDAGHDVDATSFSEEEVRSATRALNSVLCPAWEKCDPHYFHFLVGSQEKCVASGYALVLNPILQTNAAANIGLGLYGQGSLLTPNALRACAQALDLSTCDDFVRFSIEGVLTEATEVCLPLFFGTLPNDSPCAAFNQCASGRCFVPATEWGRPYTGECGRCVPAGVGRRCSAVGECAPGLICGTGGCDRFRELGESCHPFEILGGGMPSTKPCHLNLLCAGDPPTCQRPPLDNTCEPTELIGFASATCSNVPFLRDCDRETKTCEPIRFAQRNEPCGRSGLSTFLVPCSFESQSTCTWDHDREQYICKERINDGDACNILNHPLVTGGGQSVGALTDSWEITMCKNPQSTCFRGICQRNGPAECTAPSVLP